MATLNSNIEIHKLELIHKAKAGNNALNSNIEIHKSYAFLFLL